MKNDLDSMLDGVTDGASEADAGDAILTPESLAGLRAAGSRRQPPTVRRAPEPDDDGDGDRDSDEPEEEAPRQSSRGKYARYRKDELMSEVERLAGKVADLEAALNAREEARKSDPNAMRDLAATISLMSSFGFGIAGNLRGPHWYTTPEQNNHIGASGAIALAPYASEWDWLPIAQFAIVLGGTIGQKYAEDVRIQKLQQEPDDKAHS